MPNEYAWPADLFDPSEVLQWLTQEVGLRGVTGPTRILYAKRFGVTAEYADSQRSYIVKGSKHPLAAHGPALHAYLSKQCGESVPTVVAGRSDGETAWTVFAPIDGTLLEDQLGGEALAKLARTFATIQLRAAAGSFPDELPRSRLEDLQSALAKTVGAAEAHRETWAEEGSGPTRCSPADAAAMLRSVSGPLEDASSALRQCGWPDSVDHVDLHTGNVLVVGEEFIVIDWEEAVVGFPACSLDRLLGDARELDGFDGVGRSPSENAVIDAYCDTISWGAAGHRAEIVEQAVRVNRVAFAGQLLEFSGYFGRPQGGAKLMGMIVDRVLEAWTEQ